MKTQSGPVVQIICLGVFMQIILVKYPRDQNILSPNCS